jgi:hypothetical protein
LMTAAGRLVARPASDKPARNCLKNNFISAKLS